MAVIFWHFVVCREHFGQSTILYNRVLDTFYKSIRNKWPCIIGHPVHNLEFLGESVQYRRRTGSVQSNGGERDDSLLSTKIRQIDSRKSANIIGKIHRHFLTAIRQESSNLMNELLLLVLKAFQRYNKFSQQIHRTLVIAA